MVDLQTILADHKSKYAHQKKNKLKEDNREVATYCEIPDLFFDEILVFYKLTRSEVMVLMFLYRNVWSRPNLYRIYGISQLLSYNEMAKALAMALEDIYHALRKLEEYTFISTIRSGQYFVRKYFLKELDEKYCQTYDDFEI